MLCGHENLTVQTLSTRQKATAKSETETEKTVKEARLLGLVWKGMPVSQPWALVCSSAAADNGRHRSALSSVLVHACSLDSMLQLMSHNSCMQSRAIFSSRVWMVNPDP